MDPKETSALEALRQKRPATVTEVQQILGLLGYYRHYVPNFSRRAKVLYDLLKQDQGQDPRNQTQRKQSKDKKTKPQRRKNDPVKWEAVHQDALESILDCLKQPPDMAYPDFDLPFVLHTDASKDGLGTVLYQKQNGKLRVIDYGSQTLIPAENYHMHAGKLEFLALKWAVTEHFQDYLYYTKQIMVYTDNNPLT